MTYWVGVQSVGQKMYVIPQTEDQDYLFSSWQSWIEAGLLALSSHLEAGQWIYVFYNLFVKFSSNFLSGSVDGKKKQISLPGFVWSQETGACLGCSDLWSQQQFACCPSYSQHLHTTTITTPGLAGRSDCRLQTAAIDFTTASQLGVSAKVGIEQTLQFWFILRSVLHVKYYSWLVWRCYLISVQPYEPDRFLMSGMLLTGLCLPGRGMRG